MATHLSETIKFGVVLFHPEKRQGKWVPNKTQPLDMFKWLTQSANSRKS